MRESPGCEMSNSEAAAIKLEYFATANTAVKCRTERFGIALLGATRPRGRRMREGEVTFAVNSGHPIHALRLSIGDITNGLI
jgi:hypothetical protein